MIKQAFSETGALAQHIQGFRAREPQVDMAHAVADTVKDGGQLLVEAETGTGKTFAYLVPALLSGKKVVISTGSKNLQDQLYHRDLPIIQSALGYASPIALLKGRRNYLCIERLNRYMIEQQGGRSALKHEELADLARIKRIASETASGDLSEIPDLAEDAGVIPHITSSNDNCLGKRCPHYDDCYLVKARKKAMDAQLVVVNHHLFFADIAVKETGFGDLLPTAEIYLFDEAHQLPDIAALYFGESVSSRRVIDLCKDIEFLYRKELKDLKQLSRAADQLSMRVQDLRICFGMEQGRGDWRPMLSRSDIGLCWKRMMEAIDLVYQLLKVSLNRSELADNCFERLVELKNGFNRMTETGTPGFSYWFDCTSRHFTLHLTPLSVAEKFHSVMQSNSTSWVFTSATLSVNEGFEHFHRLMGTQGAREMRLASAFDYPEQAQLCVPRLLPEVNDPRMAETLVQKLTPVIEANQGRCFFLCTSYAMMRKLAEGFRQSLNLPVYMQGEDSKQALLDKYLDDGNALLVATSSFWEGVDIRGQALSCVIIDKLPFSSPDDPLMKARMEDCRRQGGDPFSMVQLPQAVISLKQGVGRLIRDHMDRGAVIICDNRLVNRPYGQMFLNSLPAFHRTRDLDEVIRFLQAHEEVSTEIP